MANSEAFLVTFATIEKWLRQMDGADRILPFSKLVEQVALRHSAVDRFRVDLKEYANLRNAIVHERTDGHVIAEPNDRAVADFTRICASLTNPPAVIPKFQVTVKTRTLDESIGDAVREMRVGSFSQLPILREGKVIDLLTAGTVARWLAHELENDLVSLKDTKISEVLPHVEEKDHYCLLPRKATLLDALSKFEEFAARGKDLDAILITTDGRPNQPLLGIITLYDLPTILAECGLKRVSAT